MIKYFHNRAFDIGTGLISGKSGETVAYIHDKADNTVYYTLAHCNSKDNFCRKIGRNVAGGRLCKAGKWVKWEPMDGNLSDKEVFEKLARSV